MPKKKTKQKPDKQTKPQAAKRRFRPKAIEWGTLAAKFAEDRQTMEKLCLGTWSTWLPAAPQLATACAEMDAILARYEAGERTEAMFHDLTEPQLST